MRAYLRLVMLLLIGMQATLAAQPAPSAQDAQYGEWMSYYYVDKDASRVTGFLKWIQNSRILDRNDTVMQPIAAFLSVIFADNPLKLRVWMKNGQFTDKAKLGIEVALWLSGNRRIISEVFMETPNFVDVLPPPLLKIKLKQPGDLDMMWSAFSASGNDAYVKKVIDVLDDSMPLTGDKTGDMLMRGAAGWSLGNNMMQHELVSRLVHKEAGKRSGSVKKKLEEILLRNKENATPFPHRDGDFSAMMIVTDKKDLTAYDKPSNEGLRFRQVSTAKPGDSLAIKIVFTGMQLTEDLKANVTFDLKVLDPDGNLYSNTDLKGIAALKAKVPMRFRVFDNKAIVIIRFEPKDKVGKYKITAEISDNIGKKKIPLTRQVELTQ